MKYKKSGDDVLSIGDDVLVLDIETDGLNTETSKMKWFGAFSFKTNEYYFYTYEHLEEIQRLIDEHRVVVGYNSQDFDIPICENDHSKLNFDYKVRIDLMRVLFIPGTRRSVRENIIKVDGKILKNILPNHKLKTVAEVLKLSVMKGDIDYKIFRQNNWTSEETKEILKYLYADVKITKELFEFMYKEFLPMKEFMSEIDKRRYNWFRTSVASYGYKVICHHANIKEEYGEPGKRRQYEGGYVMTPKSETIKGNIICFDFSSLYPNIFMQCNLYSHNCKCCSDNEKWNGNKMFPINGKYCIKTTGKIEKVIKNFYLKRLEYKENKDPREYTMKLIINSLYGATGSPIFKNLYSQTTASDCTLIARCCIKYAKKKFENNGYDVIYGDTDSCYILIPKGKTTETASMIAEKIVDDLQKNMPFPH